MDRRDRVVADYKKMLLEEKGIKVYNSIVCKYALSQD